MWSAGIEDVREHGRLFRRRSEERDWLIAAVTEDMDAAIGRILKLDELGIARNSTSFYSPDHAEHPDEFRSTAFKRQGSSLQEAVYVSLIIKGPNFFRHCFSLTRV